MIVIHKRYDGCGSNVAKPQLVTGNVLPYYQKYPISVIYHHSFSEPNIYLAQLQMEHCRASNIFVEIFALELKTLRMKTKRV